MRRAALLVAVLAQSANAAVAEPADDDELGSARSVDLSSGLTVADPMAGQGRFRPGLALAARFYSESHIYVSGALGTSVGTTDGPTGSGMTTAILAVAGGAGLWGERGVWTGYAGARAEWLKSLDWPTNASIDHEWFTSGIGAGPSVAGARRIGFAWGHPMAIELSASYMLYRLRRRELGYPPAVEPDPTDLDGLQFGLFLAGTLF